MKRSICGLFFLLLFVIPARSQAKIDVLHYQFHIALSDDNDSLIGISIIKFVVREKSASLSFDLTGIRKDGKGMLATVVGYRNGPAGTVFFKQENDKLLIPSKLNTGDTAEIMISYRGIPADGLIIAKNKYGHRTFFSDNWPNRAHNWIPCQDDPADKATVEFLVVAPSHYQVISNGIQMEESSLPGNRKETHWKEELPLPTKVMVIGVADFAVSNAGDLDCINLSSWVYPENRNEGFADYAMARNILNYHTNYIGPYPYKKLANVQSKTIFGGMENASAIFYYENSVTGKGQEESLISHEIVHQWFGNMATEKSFAHLWLSEGFATYLTHVYIESKYGTDSLEKEMKADRQQVIEFVRSSRRPVVDSTADYMQLLNANSYQKGSWVLHMLRREFGDSVFRKSIRQYYAAYAGKNAETKDLQKIFEAVSGKDLEQFFKQWLFTPENLSLTISWKYDEQKKLLRLHLQQLQSTAFQFPLEIAFLSKKGGRTINKINVTKKEMDFSFALPEKPLQLIADPFTSVLFEGKVMEMK